MSIEIISRIAEYQRLLYQKTTSMAGGLFSRDLEQRFIFAVLVNRIPDEHLWFIVESGSNLHTAPLRAWAPKGRPQTKQVMANRETNVTLLMVIALTGSSTSNSATAPSFQKRSLRERKRWFSGSLSFGAAK